VGKERGPGLAHFPIDAKWSCLLDYHADTSSVSYILDEFTYFFETPYDTTDSTFPECTIDRPSGASADGRMFIVNHFLDVDIFGIDIPDSAAASTTNSVSSILAQSDICLSDYGRVPNFILVSRSFSSDLFFPVTAE
jgi:hypothetical protein